MIKRSLSSPADSVRRWAALARDWSRRNDGALAGGFRRGGAYRTGFIKWLGKRREEWALAITGYIVSIPIFVDSAFVILYPVAKALAKSGKRSLLTLGVALAGGLVVTHHTVPPTPGPLG